MKEKEPKLEEITIFDALKYNPIRAIKDVSLIGLLICLASLVYSFVTKLHFIPPFAALLGAIMCTGFYFMGKVEEWDENGKKERARVVTALIGFVVLLFIVFVIWRVW